MLFGSLGPPGQETLRYAFSGVAGGAGTGAYGSRNLGLHVGDDPAVVARNRELTARELGLAPESVVFMDQVHSDVVRVVQGAGPEDVPGCDGLVANSPGVALAVMVADCVPVVMGDPEAGVVAAVHAGRRGVQNGIVGHALESMVGLGAVPDRVAARLGPSICGSCYEVPEEMSEEVLRVAPAAEARTAAGTPGLDLRRGLAGVLANLGVRDVELVGPCSRESADFFSYRRAAGAPTGRFAGFVWHATARA